jgi:hypothetical protein
MSKKKNQIRVFVVLAVICAIFPPVLLAQEAIPVTERPRPDYDAVGIRAGSFYILPRLGLGTTYDDNIYAVRRERTSDWIFLTSPEMQIRSNWSRHSLDLSAGAEYGLYASESDENYLDGSITLNGRLDTTQNAYLTGRFSHERLHEERGAPDATLLWAEPAVYHTTSGWVSYYQRFGQFSASTGLGAAHWDYRRVDLVDGTTISLDNRDRSIYNINVQLTAERHPIVRPFITTRYEWRVYDAGEAMRDSEGYRIGAGSVFDLGGVTFIEIYAGYMRQEYDDLENIDGFWYGLTMLWNPTKITTVQATAEASIREAFVAASTGIEATDVSLRIDHEFRRNLLAGVMGSYNRDNYQGIDLTEQYYTAGPRLTYLWNRYLNAEIAYTHLFRESDIEWRDYRINRFTLMITGSI